MNKFHFSGMLTVLASTVLLSGAAEGSSKFGSIKTSSIKTGSTKTTPKLPTKSAISPSPVTKGSTSFGKGLPGKTGPTGGDLGKFGKSPILGPNGPITAGKGPVSGVKGPPQGNPKGKPFNHQCCGWWSGWFSCSPCDSWLGCFVDGGMVEPFLQEPPVSGPTEAAPTTDAATPPETVSPPVLIDQAKPQNVRFLKVRNESAAKLQVFVQFAVTSSDGYTTWLPGDPQSEKAVTLDLEPGHEVYVENDGQRIAGNRVRIWANSEAGSFMQFRGQDLWLVPEQIDGGEHAYLAQEIKTFTFVFPRVE